MFPQNTGLYSLPCGFVVSVDSLHKPLVCHLLLNFDTLIFAINATQQIQLLTYCQNWLSTFNCLMTHHTFWAFRPIVSIWIIVNRTISTTTITPRLTEKAATTKWTCHCGTFANHAAIPSAISRRSCPSSSKRFKTLRLWRYAFRNLRPNFK